LGKVQLGNFEISPALMRDPNFPIPKFPNSWLVPSSGLPGCCQSAARLLPKGRLMAERRREWLNHKFCPNHPFSAFLFPIVPKTAQNGNPVFSL
jgi:hypothetical protein